MDVDQYPKGSRVDVYWRGDDEWYTASVIKTRVKSHTIDGEKMPCREILCFYDLDRMIKWHSLHDNDVRECPSQLPPDESDIDDPFPAGSRIDVWWPGESRWFTATVLTTRTAWHSVRRVKTLCRELYCDYDLDGHMQWHSIHNNKIRQTVEGESHGGIYCTPCFTQSTLYTQPIAPNTPPSNRPRGGLPAGARSNRASRDFCLRMAVTPL